MWSYLRELLDRPGVCKGIPEMCEALESVYYGAKNEDIADALLRVLQTNSDIYLAKELLGYTYYNIQSTAAITTPPSLKYLRPCFSQSKPPSLSQ